MTIELDFKKMKGLVPVIAQDYKTNKVLMLGYMNKTAWNQTLKTGKVVYYSRSKKKLWQKGEVSGNVQLVKDILVDCDADTIVLKIKQVGKAACHKGYESCFFRKVSKNKLKTMGKRIFEPKKVYGEVK